MLIGRLYPLICVVLQVYFTQFVDVVEFREYLWSFFGTKSEIIIFSLPTVIFLNDFDLVFAVLSRAKLQNQNKNWKNSSLHFRIFYP